MSKHVREYLSLAAIGIVTVAVAGVYRGFSPLVWALATGLVLVSIGAVVWVGTLRKT
jgi:hypothetical protein